MSTMPNIVFLSSDLLFYSQISSSAKAAGHSSCMIKRLEEIDSKCNADSVQWLIVDLSQHQTDLTTLASDIKAKCPNAHLLGFGAHVDTQALRAAQEAGFDDVMPRSKFHSLLPRLFHATENS